MSEELKPCPFCGKDPEVETDREDASLDTVRCSNFKCAMNGLEPVYVWAWNTRPAEDQMRELLVKATNEIRKWHSMECELIEKIDAQLPGKPQALGSGPCEEKE